MKTYLLAFFLIAGCGARVEPGGSTGALGEGEPTQSGVTETGTSMEDVGWVCDTPGFHDYDAYAYATPDSTAVDTRPEDAGPALPSVDCLADDFGPSSGTLVDFHYEQQVGACGSSDCSDFVMFGPSCVMTLQVGGAKTSATLPAADCALFTRWVTSDLLINHLRDGVTCYGKDVPGKFESTVVQRSDGYAAKKTASCEEEPFASHRACIASFRAKYFPAK